MASTTRWRDTVVENIDQAIQKLIDDVTEEEKVTNIIWENWSIQKCFTDNKTIKLNGKDIKFNYITYAYDQVDTTNENKTARKDGFIIVYSTGYDVNYIIDQNSYAMKLLRKLLSYNGRNELERGNFDFSNDFFSWLIYRVYNKNCNIEVFLEKEKKLTVDTIKGIKGDTLDLQTQVTASGEAVMNIISTLSFLLESQNLNQVTLDIAYREHSNIEVTLSNRNTVAITEERYLGALISEDCSAPELISTILLTLYIEVLPILIQSYQSEIDSNLWGQGKCVDFLKQVANDLSKKVTKRVEDLEQRPEQLKMSFDGNVLLDGVSQS